MAGSPVRRCVAVASHGRRCQQSPFRGSPYCWHHLQSRKVPATSRPMERPPRMSPLDEDPSAVPVVSVDRAAIAVRLASQLDADALTRLVAFVESRRDGDLLLSRDDGILSLTEAERARRRSAAG